MKLVIKYCPLGPIIICSNDDPGLTLTYFAPRSNFVAHGSEWKKRKIMDFSETFVACDLKAGICNQLNE